jgi:hypothetical protein
MNSVSLDSLQILPNCDVGVDARHRVGIDIKACPTSQRPPVHRTDSSHYRESSVLPPDTIVCCASHAKEQSVDYRNLRPSEVILDPENPRLPDGTSSDREAINRLLDEGADALVGLARDIARTGQTNPAELPIAIKEGNKYLILEGNRRFAALKLLKDPAFAENEDHERAFRRAATLGQPPKTVFTLVMANREEADHWIVLRHTGDNNGVGVKRWSAGQTATHRRRANRSIDSGTKRSIIIADDLEEAYAADEEIADLVRQVRSGKLTNIGRFFSPDVLTTMHFVVEVNDDPTSLRAGSLMVRHSSEQLRGFFAWAVRYILDNPVDAYKNRQIRADVLYSVAQLIPTLADAAAEPFSLVDRPPTSAAWPQHPDADLGAGENSDRSPDSNGWTGGSSDEPDATPEENPASEGNEQRPRPKKTEAKQERYILQGLRLPRHPERIQQLLKECRNLNLEEYPGIACVMMRVIVELSVSSPDVLALSGESENSRLKDKIIGALKYLDPDIEHSVKRDKELTHAFLEASGLGVQYLHSFVHNPNVYPDQHLARRFSSAFRPLLKRVDDAL